MDNYRATTVLVPSDWDYQTYFSDYDHKMTKINLLFVDYMREITQLKQRIASLEMETNKLDDICADNSKLKQENAALIRIISKLNKH